MLSRKRSIGRFMALILILYLLAPAFTLVVTRVEAATPTPTSERDDLYVPIGKGTSYTYNGIPFEVDGVDLVARKSSSIFVPVETRDLSGYTADKVHIIEHAGWATSVPNGVTVGNINVFYEDGTSDSIDLITGTNIAEWAYDRPEVQCCLAHDKLPPAYSWWTNLGSSSYYWGHSFYVSIDTQERPLDYFELVLDPASYTS